MLEYHTHTYMYICVLLYIHMCAFECECVRVYVKEHMGNKLHNRIKEIGMKIMSKEVKEMKDVHKNVLVEK